MSEAVARRSGRTEEVRHVEFRASEDGDGQTLEGYAAVFNQWTDIRDAQGTYRERIAPGAFKRSLGQRMPVLQFDHGTHPLIGSIPLGSITAIREDRNGLFIKARMSDNWLVEPIRDAIRNKAISGMSFRFKTVRDSWAVATDGVEERTVEEVELPELGPVVFPAYTQTSLAMRSLVGALDTETRAALAQELSHPDDDPAGVADEARDDTSTPDVASGPAQGDSPDEPPVVSHEDTRNRMAAALNRIGRHPRKDPNDVHQ